MEQEWVIYFNSKCGNCRGTLDILQRHGINPKIVNYLEALLSIEDLRSLIALLGKRPKEIVRTKEGVFSQLELDLEDDAAVLKALVENPSLIQRPIVVHGKRAIVARPPETVEQLFK